MFSGIFSKDSTVGIDIGSSCIKAIEIVPNGKGWELSGVAVAPTPADAVKDGIVLNVVEVADQIRFMLKDAGIKATAAICAVSGSQVIVRQVAFPKMPEPALRKSIKYEASRYISTNTESSVVEFEILGEAKDSSQMNVMLVSAPADLVDSRVRVIEAAGLDPLVVDIEAFALIRSLVDLNASDQYLRRTIALLDLGASHTDVNIVNHGQFALTRNIPIGGVNFTNAIKSLTASTFEEAEALKIEMASKQILDSNSIISDDNRCWKVVQPLLDELIREIRRSIHFYQSQFPEDSTDTLISKIVLTGGSARIAGIDKYISSMLNIPTETADVLKNTVVGAGKVPKSFLDAYSPIIAVGAGLALREIMPEVNHKAVA